MDGFLRHKSGSCWKLGEAGNRTFPDSFRGTVPLPAHSPETPDSRLIRKPVPVDRPWKGFVAIALASMPNEQACLSLQLATHDPASDRASNHFICIEKTLTVPSCADNPNSTAQHANPCTGCSDPIQFPRFTTLVSPNLPEFTWITLPKMPTLDHVARQSPCYLECSLSPVLPEDPCTTSGTSSSYRWSVPCSWTVQGPYWTLRLCQ